MTEEPITMDTLEGEYMDSLVKVALEYDDFLEAEEVMAKCHLAVPAKDRVMARQAYLRAMSSCAEDHRQSKKRRRISSCKSFATKVTKVAAYIMVLMTVAAPVAMANVPEIRARVMSLLVNTDNEQQAALFHITKYENIVTYVPPEWNGKYYPLYIPSNLKLSSCSSFFDSSEARYINQDGKVTIFTEYGADFELSSGIENSSVVNLSVNGIPVYSTAYPERGYVSLIWADNDRWFVIESYSFTQEDLLPIIESVRQIVV